MFVQSFNDWSLNETYYSQSHNLYKVVKSKEPIIGKPIFHEEDAKSIYSVRRKIQDDLVGYEKHMKDAEEKDKGWREAAKGRKDEKGSLSWYDSAAKTRNLAMKIVKEAAKFMQEYNQKFDQVKQDIMSTDHVKVAKAIVALQDIYPINLIMEAGKLKRMKKMKFDAQFVNDVLKWTESIRKAYETLQEASKLLGKTDKQILGARKQSANQRMRWGMY